MIGLLDRENDLDDHADAGSLGEGHGNYLSDVVNAVSILRDPRTAPALLGAVKHYSPIGVIAGFGDPGLKATLEKLKTVPADDDELRMDLTRVLGTMAYPANMRKLSSDSVLQLKGRLADLAVNDSSDLVRETAVESLGHFIADPEIKTLLTHIAEEDRGVDRLDNRTERYPVREAAKKILEANSPPKE